jgi:flagellar motor switch/type III secretory pathway protein FliN
MDVLPYPWHALPKIPRAALPHLALAQERLLASFHPKKLPEALSALLDTEVTLELGELGVAVPERRVTEVALRVGSTPITLGVEPDLAQLLLARILGRPLALAGSSEPFPPSLRGALAAIAVEIARRVSDEPVALDEPHATGSGLCAEAIVRIEGRAYRAHALVEGKEAPTRALGRRPANDLGEALLAVPLVVAASLARPSDLARLVPGAAFVPSEAWVDAKGHGRGLIAAARRERGVWVDLPPDGRIVVRDATAELAADTEEQGFSMADVDDVNQTLTDAALDAPVVVRVELGVVSLTARVWAEIAPGDVIQTGHPVGQPVLLRIAGRAVARGELVSVDGELGVRVRELLGQTSEA